MRTPTIEELRELSWQLPEKIPYLKMLVLFGSRATGQVHANSDWDFASLYDEELRKACIKDAWSWFEAPLIIGQIFKINGDQIDVVDLNECSSLIAHFVARDGKIIYEKEPEEFQNFQTRALKTSAELKRIQQDLYKKIDTALEKWGV